MAFCKQCGTDLGEAKFCPNCGTSADGILPQQNVGAPGADTRQRCIADFQHMMSYFGAKSDQYIELDTVNAEVAKREEQGYGGWIVMAVISALIGIFSSAFFFYIAAAGFIVGFILLRKKNKAKLAEATARRDALAEELSKYYADYGYCAIGLEYTHPAVLPELYARVDKGRATTPSDAINIYLADQTEKEREKREKELIEQNEQLNKEMKKASRYAAASFWLKR